MLKTVKNKFRMVLMLAFSLLLTNCDSDNIVATELETIADYTVTFESTWSSTTHPDNFPSNPHFSGLIGAVHNNNVAFWEEGDLASAGIKQMAEKGSKDSLISEIEKAIQANNASIVLTGGGIGTSPGSVSLSFQMHRDFPLVTIVSMLAPSPDWFVGVTGLDLTANNSWLDTIVVELYVYDAGTDSGNEYTSSNLETSPPENIAKIIEPPFKINDSIPSVGTFTFKRIK